MDPLFEQRLRDEVIYLHSLWHQGPPRDYLQPSQTTQFKKHKKPKRKNRKSTAITGSESNSSPASEWPCPASPPSTTGWPCLQPQTNPPLSAEEQWKLAGIHAQKKALSLVHEFFISNNDDDDSDAAIDSSSSDDEDEFMEKGDERDDHSFFNKVFKEDTKLREYYDKSFANGEFSCLVCGALGGKKTLKKFKGCLPLVQHSIAINSNKRGAHRAFGQAVCEVLGWDLDRLPAIVSMLSDKLGEGKCGSDNKGSSSMVLVNNFASVSNDTLDGEKDEAAPGSGCMGSGISSHGDEGDTNSADAVKNLEDCTKVQTHGLTISSLTSPDADKNLENFGMAYQHNVEEPVSQGLKIGNSNGDNKDGSSMALIDNIDSVNSDTLEGKIDEAAPESGYVGSGISLHGDERDMNSVMCSNAGKNMEDCGVVHTQNVEERALDGLPINSLTFPDADGNMENLGMANQHEVEEPASAGVDNSQQSGKC